MGRKFAAVLCSTLLLSPGWLGGTGFTLLFGLVPLLWISDSYDASRRSWWKVFGWALLTFVLWNVSTIWWIWLATPVGPFAATIASSFLNMVAFMLFHTVSKKGPKALAYTLLVSGWIATEYWYTTGDFSWPWLLLGNGFSHEVWAVQWYEYTGIFGGTLWVLLSNILLYEAWDPNSSVFRVVSFAWAGFGAAFGPVMLFSLFWKRANKQGALAGMITGGAVVFIWKYLIAPMGGAWAIYELLPAFLAACIAIVIVSLATPAPEKAVTDTFDEICGK